MKAVLIGAGSAGSDSKANGAMEMDCPSRPTPHFSPGNPQEQRSSEAMNPNVTTLISKPSLANLRLFLILPHLIDASLAFKLKL